MPGRLDRRHPCAPRIHRRTSRSAGSRAGSGSNSWEAPRATRGPDRSQGLGTRAGDSLPHVVRDPTAAPRRLAEHRIPRCSTLSEHRSRSLAALLGSPRTARARSAGGIARPRTFAVFRLMASSNLVGCSTGRSAGCRGGATGGRALADPLHRLLKAMCWDVLTGWPSG